MTLVSHVDDMKISHKDPQEVDIMLIHLKSKYGILLETIKNENNTSFHFLNNAPLTKKFISKFHNLGFLLIKYNLFSSISFKL